MLLGRRPKESKGWNGRLLQISQPSKHIGRPLELVFGVDFVGKGMEGKPMEERIGRERSEEGKRKK